MSLKLANNATSLLSSSIDTLATVVSLTAGDEGKFPALAAGDWFPVVVVDAAANREIMRATARAGVNLTVTRAQEGTVARAFTAGARVDLRLTTQAIVEMIADATLLTTGIIADAVLPVRLRPAEQFAADANAITVSGRYYTNPATLNIPAPAASGYLWVDTFDYPAATYQYQEWQDVDSAKRWARRKVSSVWGAWYELFIAEQKIPPGTVLDYAGFGPAAPAGFLFPYGQAVLRTQYPDLEVAIYCGDALNPTANHGYRCSSNTTPSTTRNIAGLYIVLPDYRGRVGAGKDNMGGASANRLTDPAATLNGLNGDVMGEVGGLETHTLTEAQLPAHDHSLVSATAKTDVEPNHTHGIAGTSPIPSEGAWSNRPVGTGTGTQSGPAGTHQHALVGNTANAGSTTAHNNVQPTIVVNKIIKY